MTRLLIRHCRIIRAADATVLVNGAADRTRRRERERDARVVIRFLRERVENLANRQAAKAHPYSYALRAAH